MKVAVVFLFISALFSLKSLAFKYHYVQLAKNYTEAKLHCREIYRDLATIHNPEDMDLLKTMVPISLKRAWIGLERGHIGAWHWALVNTELDFLNWKAGEPQNSIMDSCAAMDSNGKWFESDCGPAHSFVCDGDGNTTSPIFVSQPKSWRKAQEHCRNIFSDLVSIGSAEENREVQNMSGSQTVWIGLFKDSFRWSDGSNSSYRFWRASQPGQGSQGCVLSVFRDDGKWNDRNCDIIQGFICEGATKYNATMPPDTTGAIPNNWTTLSQSLPQTSTSETTQVTKGHASTEQSNNASITSKQSTSGPMPHEKSTLAFATSAFVTREPVSTALSKLNMTEYVSISTTKFNTTNNFTANPFTAILTPQKETTVIHTQSTLPISKESASPTHMTTRHETTAFGPLILTDSTTVVPPESSHGLTADNLKLIRKNMTWNEAVNYCREHHIDLMSVTTEIIQDWVAKLTANATSSHIWLGLRYTCTFNFWFWIRSDTGCYQNWAPGHGSPTQHECGTAGAIETTGEQQWVGLPDTNRHNFICYTCA